MEISFVSKGEARPGAWVVGLSDSKSFTAAVAALDEKTGGAVKRALGVARFQSKVGQVVEILAPAGLRSSRLLLAGLGKAAAFDGAAAERLAATIVGRLMASGEKALTFAIDVPEGSPLSEEQLAAHLAFGAKLRSYRFDIYRTTKREDEPTLAAIAVATAAVPAARKLWADLDPVADGIYLARDLVNEPANVLFPDEFARRLTSLSKLGVKVERLGVAQMQKLGMNALLGVGQGSGHESRLLVLQWNGAKTSGKTKSAPIAFVGKGVCFDSGGLSLKPANSMMGMKGDMGGAAAVAGVMHALAARKARVNAIGVIGLVENMPDGKAMRPNDIIKTMSGQTVEVLNTDAEGRLVLADALWYTQSRFQPRFMVNLATLTGAIITALGAEHAGLFSNNDELSERITAAGTAEGEPVWRLPLGDAYDKMLKSKFADMKNVAGPNASSITAAQFLQRFVNKLPWAHLDIAGVAWQDGEQKPLAPSWGTGWGVRVLNRLVADHYEG
jgi:leucyl aminopeptidase